MDWVGGKNCHLAQVLFLHRLMMVQSGYEVLNRNILVA